MPRQKANSKQLKAVSKKTRRNIKTTKQKAVSREPKARTGLTAQVISLDGKASRMSLPPEIFSLEAKPATLAQVVRVYLSNQRAGTAATKTRGEVRGGGRKPWRQKGTGRARAGSTRAPHWRGGGVVFGPVSRDFSLKLPKKVRQKALFGAISQKFAAGDFRIVDDFEKIKPQTRELVKALEKLNLPQDKKALMIVNGEAESLIRAGRNLPMLSFCKVSNLTTYQVLAVPVLIFTKNAISALEKRRFK